MKSKLVKLILIALIPLVAGCADWLDIKPENEVVLENFWQNETEAKQVLMACYRSFSESDNVRRMIIWGEARSDNVIEGTSTEEDVRKILEVDINASNNYASWASMYRTINYCNTFLHFGPEAVEKDESFFQTEYFKYKAEALTLRALAYFYLVRTFGEVPLITEPSIDDTQNYKAAKSTEREVLDTIISNLEWAEAWAPERYDKTPYPKSRITRDAVRSLLADVYLWDGRYIDCINACDRILDNKDLILINDEEMYRDLFYKGNSKESIFEFVYDDDVMMNSAVRTFYGWDGYQSGQLSFPNFLVQGTRSPFNFRIGSSYESESDIRLKDFVNINGLLTGYYYIFKYAGIDHYESNGIDLYQYTITSPSWIVYRKPDAILMKAEALVQSSDSGDVASLRAAVELVNQTYLRANPEPGTDSLKFENYTSKEKVAELVLRERQREFLFEGKRWFDLMRITRREGESTTLVNYVSPKFTLDQALQISKLSVLEALYMPISQRELDANPELEQNPYYETATSVTPSN